MKAPLILFLLLPWALAGCKPVHPSGPASSATETKELRRAISVLKEEAASRRDNPARLRALAKAVQIEKDAAKLNSEQKTYVLLVTGEADTLAYWIEGSWRDSAATNISDAVELVKKYSDTALEKLK